MSASRADNAIKQAAKAYGWLMVTCLVLVALLAATIWITARKDATTLENGLLQFILFAAGVVFSFYSGRQSVQATTQEVLRPHGTKSVRRLLTLAAGIQGFSVVIDQERIALDDTMDTDTQSVPLSTALHSLDVIQTHIPGEIRTVEDALEDWRDVVPDQVEALLKERSGND